MRWLRRAIGPRPVLAGSAARCAPRSAEPIVSAGELRELIEEAVDFDRVNSGAVRLVLGAVNLATGAETFFDNDRHVLGPDHVLAEHAVAGTAAGRHRPVSASAAARSRCRRSTMRARPTRCALSIDGYDPVPGKRGGISRSAREIAALRRNHDLRRMIALLGRARAAGAAGRCRHQAMPRRGQQCDDDDPAPGA